MVKKYISWALVVLWMILIFFLSHQDATESSLTSGNAENVLRFLIINIREDKWLENLVITNIRSLAHFGVYLVLGILLINALGPNKFLLAIIVGIGYAISDEIHQLYVPGRAFQLIDIIIDSTGLILGCYIHTLILKRVKC